MPTTKQRRMVKAPEPEPKIRQFAYSEFTLLSLVSRGPVSVLAVSENKYCTLSSSHIARLMRQSLAQGEVCVTAQRDDSRPGPAARQYRLTKVGKARLRAYQKHIGKLVNYCEGKL